MGIYSGKFITFEGVDGSGKTTQIKLLESYLMSRGFKVFVTREPGGTGLRFAEAIRKLILHPSYSVHPRSELLLYEASRAQHVERLIRPKLAQGYWVLCDRFTDATLAYQGGGRSIPLRELIWLNAFATNHLEPDLTILLDIPVAQGLRKARNLSKQKNKKKIYINGDRLEREAIDFHKRVQQSYRRLAVHFGRIHRVNVARVVADTQKKIIGIIEKQWPFLIFQEKN